MKNIRVSGKIITDAANNNHIVFRVDDVVPLSPKLLSAKPQPSGDNFKNVLCDIHPEEFGQPKLLTSRVGQNAHATIRPALEAAGNTVRYSHEVLFGTLFLINSVSS